MKRRLQFHRQNEFEETARESVRAQSRQSIHEEKAKKGERRMPGLPEAKKDAVSCENGRGSANRN